jgi:hypothetical protein
MILISHRGNIDGRRPEMENNPNYIDEALSKGYEVEIDIWKDESGSFMLGHDEPQYYTNLKWLRERSDKLWIHCKDFNSLLYFNTTTFKFNYFWHEHDTLTLTSFKFIWAYPGKQPIRNSIAVMPEIHNDNIDNCIGICSDFIKNYDGK